MSGSIPRVGIVRNDTRGVNFGCISRSDDEYKFIFHSGKTYKPEFDLDQVRTSFKAGCSDMVGSIRAEVSPSDGNFTFWYQGEFIHMSKADVLEVFR